MQRGRGSIEHVKIHMNMNMNIKGIKANSILFRLGGVVTHFVLFCVFLTYISSVKKPVTSYSFNNNEGV